MLQAYIKGDREVKFLDFSLSNETALSHSTGADQVGMGATERGWCWMSSGYWQSYRHGPTDWQRTTCRGNILDRVRSGEFERSIVSRIGNRISPLCIKGRITVTAATAVCEVHEGVPVNHQTEQHGEMIYNSSELRREEIKYMRTVMKLAWVKDNKMYTPMEGDEEVDGLCNWEDVYDTGGQNIRDHQQRGTPGGIHCEINMFNASRYTILKEINIHLTANNPQKSFEFELDGADIGPIRYNSSPNQNALVNKGIYLVWAAFTVGVDLELVDPHFHIRGPQVIFNSRLYFTDS